MFQPWPKRPAVLKSLAAAGLAIFAGALAATARAETPDPLAVQVGIASQYVGKGLDKSDDRGAAFGAARYTHGLFYADAFASQAHTAQGGDSEVILTVGVQPKVGDYKLDLAVLDRRLPGTRKGYDAHFTEYQADVSRTVGRFAGGLKINYSPDGYGPTRAAWWNEARGAWKVSPADKLTFAVADRRAQGGVGYTAWNAGLKHKFGKNINADLRWYDTNGHQHGEPYKGRVVVSLSYDI